MNAKIRKQLRDSVLRGVRLLDEKDPAWWNGAKTNGAVEGMIGHIDVDKLDLGEPSACVLGQRFREPERTGIDRFEVGLRALGLLDATDGEYDIRAYRNAARYGFTAASNACESIGSVDAVYSLLTELWVSVIQSRRFPRRKIARTAFARQANKNFNRRASAA